MADQQPPTPPPDNNKDTSLAIEETTEDQKEADDMNRKEIQKAAGKNNNLPVGSYITGVPTGVDVHPLVLLSVVDHFARTNQQAMVQKRVVGLLLGNVTRADQYSEARLDINNCFGIPFDEDPRNPDVWFLDTNYAEEMFLMSKKVYPRIKVIGWYSSGPLISPNDLNIHLLVADRFCPNPVYCIVNTDPKRKGVPVQAYITTESRSAGTASATSRSVEFRNIVSNLGTVEAEEIGIEHLLRDLTDSTVTTLSTKISDRHLALQRLEQLLANVEVYLRDVVDGNLPMNMEILNSLQELVNTMPAVKRLKQDSGMLVTANDEALHAFVASVTRCVSAMYETILNRRKLKREKAKRLEEEAAAKKKKEEEAAEEEEKKKKEATAASEAKKE